MKSDQVKFRCVPLNVSQFIFDNYFTCNCLKIFRPRTVEFFII